MSLDKSIGSGRYKYGEYAYQCSTAQIISKECFPADKIDTYQLFDLVADPFELKNIYEKKNRG